MSEPIIQEIGIPEQITDWNIYVKTLRALRNPKGRRICWNDETICRLWNRDANLQDLLELFSLGDYQGNEKFFADTLAYFLEQEYSTLELLKVSALKDHESNLILESSNDL